MPQGLPAIGQEVPQGGSLPPIGAEVPQTASAAPDSGTSFLELAASGVKGVIDGLNPLPLLKSLYDDASGEFTKAQESASRGQILETMGHAIAGSPLGVTTKLAGRIGQSQIDQFAKAKAAYDKGNLSEAVGYTVAGALPLVGPMAATAGEEIGTGDPKTMAHGAGLAASLGAPKAVSAAIPASVKVPGTGMFRNVTPAETAAVQYGERAGIPIDAATATGNPVIRSAQWLADRSLGGAIPGQKAARAQTEGLARAAQQLEGRAAPYPVSPETAGTSLRGTLAAQVSDYHSAASEAYAKLAEYERASAKPVQVGTRKIGEQTVTREFPADLTVDPAEDLLRAIAKNGGIGLDKGMPGEIRMLWESRSRGAGALGRLRTKGATQETVGTSNAIGGIGGVLRKKGGKSLDMMAEALREDGFNIAGPRELLDAVDAARTARMRSPAKGSSADTFSETIEEPIMETMGMPLDLTAARTALNPLYARLKREAELVPLMGDKAKALTALDRLMQGPKIVPASVADDALSSLKGMSRFEGMPELRPEGKGIAAQAVRTLEQQVQQAVAQGGPEATAARNAGRTATVQKYEVADLLEQLKDEPVKAYRQATLPQDQGIDYLRQLQRVAPQEMPKVGRAYLSSLFDQATAEGGFGKAQRLAAEWQKLGPETKKTIFPDKALRDDLDAFFLLSKKIAENPNPSGTALAGWLPGQVGLVLFDPLKGGTITLSGFALSKLLHSKTGVRALTEAIRVPLGRSRAASAAAISRAAAMAGVRPIRAAVPTLAAPEEER